MRLISGNLAYEPYACLADEGPYRRHGAVDRQEDVRHCGVPADAFLNMKALLQRAAASSHKNVTEFLLEAGINAAENALVDRRMFRLDDHQGQAFQAILDRPVAADNPA